MRMWCEDVVPSCECNNDNFQEEFFSVTRGNIIHVIPVEVIRLQNTGSINQLEAIAFRSRLLPNDSQTIVGKVETNYIITDLEGAEALHHLCGGTFTPKTVCKSQHPFEHREYLLMHRMMTAIVETLIHCR